MTGAEVVVIIVATLTFVMNLLVLSIAYIFKQSNRQLEILIRQNQEKIEKQDRRVETLERHNASMMHSLWNLTWRANATEDFLSDTTDFRPPRIIGQTESRPRHPGE